VSDGSAVLGLGNIEPAAAMPVMEGKAALFKRFADVDAWPVCLDTKDTQAIIDTVRYLAPAYGGINLEDIAAPRCFEIEARLREILDIPVFHDDQHGTAVVVLAALRNALRVVGKSLPDVRIVISGVGAAGSAIIRLLLTQGAKRIVASDRQGVLNRADPFVEPMWAWVAERTNSEGLSGSLKDVIAEADVFIGVSAPNLLDGEDIARMAPDAIVFALANPVPELTRWPPASTRQSWPPAETILWSTCWRSPACSAGFSTSAPAKSRTPCSSPPPKPSPTSWQGTSSIPATSCRASSTSPLLPRSLRPFGKSRVTPPRRARW
jgi:malic enzyme